MSERELVVCLECGAFLWRVGEERSGRVQYKFADRFREELLSCPECHITLASSGVRVADAADRRKYEERMGEAVYYDEAFHDAVGPGADVVPGDYERQSSALNDYIGRCRRRVADRKKKAAREKAEARARRLEVYYERVARGKAQLPEELRDVAQCISPSIDKAGESADYDKLLFEISINGAPLVNVEMRVFPVSDSVRFKQVSVLAVDGIEEGEYGDWYVSLSDPGGLLEGSVWSDEEKLAGIEEAVVIAANRAGDWHRAFELALEKERETLRPLPDLNAEDVVGVVMDEVDLSVGLSPAAVIRVGYMAMVAIYGVQAVNQALAFDLGDVAVIPGGAE